MTFVWQIFLVLHTHIYTHTHLRQLTIWYSRLFWTNFKIVQQLRQAACQRVLVIKHQTHRCDLELLAAFSVDVGVFVNTVLDWCGTPCFVAQCHLLSQFVFLCQFTQVSAGKGLVIMRHKFVYFIPFCLCAF